ncbi:hypothetical protein [Acidithrix sp. C25]|uniref:hypothetical protein n=1 Tax=Acidithrix sp. C25 TaxID=1671482 RepID=UPI00191BB6EB|nr:hypothetical protein [Acidithrix sp. C25]
MHPPGIGGIRHSSFDAMAGSISRLATGVAVILTPSRSHKGTAAPRAYDHTHIVTLL